MRLVVGIDPGIEGAIAVLDADTGALVSVEDMPCDTVRVGRTDRPRVSAIAVAAALRKLNSAQVWIEQVGAGRKQGVSSMFTFGYSAGILAGAVAGLGWPKPTLVAPAVWKRVMQCPADKDGATARACELFPAAAQYFTRVNRKGAVVGIDGRAEAALIARYGARFAS